jgi:hypothetical protein
MSPAARNDGMLVVGGVPRAELLPPELEIVKKLRSQRRGIVTLGVLVIAAVIAGYGLATFFDTVGQVQLDAANKTSDDLIAEQGKFVEVQQLQQQVAAAKAAQAVGTSTEVDWKFLVEQILGTQVGDLKVDGFIMSGATPTTPFEESTVPLDHTRVSELSLTVHTGKPSSTADWLAQLATLTGFADARIDSITEDGGRYNIKATVHLNDLIFTKRFDQTTEATQ